MRSLQPSWTLQTTSRFCTHASCSNVLVVQLCGGYAYASTYQKGWSHHSVTRVRAQTKRAAPRPLPRKRANAAVLPRVRSPISKPARPRGGPALRSTPARGDTAAGKSDTSLQPSEAPSLQHKQHSLLPFERSCCLCCMCVYAHHREVFFPLLVTDFQALGSRRGQTTALAAHTHCPCGRCAERSLPRSCPRGRSSPCGGLHAARDAARGRSARVGRGEGDRSQAQRHGQPTGRGSPASQPQP
jgi:hypothetical protein